MTKSDIELAWKQVFPNSMLKIELIRGELHCRGALAKDSTELPQGLIGKDPLTYLFSVRQNPSNPGSFVYEESIVSLDVIPEENSLTLPLILLRRRPIKNVTSATLATRFETVRQFCLSHASSFRNPLFNIQDK